MGESDIPTTGQLILLAAAIACFAVGGVLSISRLSRESERRRIAAKSLIYWGIVAAAAVLVWHSITRRNWLPLDDNFDALIWLALLLAGFVAYMQRMQPALPLRGLDWFIMPAAMVFLVGAEVVGRERPHLYVENIWTWTHYVSSMLGAAAFVVAGAGGAMFLVVSHRLRRKTAIPGPNLGSLERLESFTFVAVSLGFALLTIGLITGLVIVVRNPAASERLGKTWYYSPKVVLAFAVWVVYALVLHAPINPSFRGRRAAMLSVVGLVLMLGTLAAVQFMPAR
jgi:ABC-type uncharacterized transport system permease subunit